MFLDSILGQGMNQEDWVKVGKGFLIALAGAALAYSSEVFLPMLESSDNAVLLALAAFGSTAVNLLRKALNRHKEKQPKSSSLNGLVALLFLPAAFVSSGFGQCIAQEYQLPQNYRIVQEPETDKPKIIVDEKPEKSHAQKVLDGQFRKELLKAIKSARKDGSITFFQAARLRVATWSPAFVEEAERVAVVQMAFSENAELLPYDADGKVETSRIDWEQFAEFLKVFIPLLLQILSAFGVG